MSATAATDCEHDWEDTGICFHRYSPGADLMFGVSYCPTCREFGVHLQRITFSPWQRKRNYARVNERKEQRSEQARQAWLAAHYPEHVEEEA